MLGSRDASEAVYAELCKADPSQSVFVLPADGSLRQRLCATDRGKLMEFVRDLYQHVNVSAVWREVNSY